MVSKFIYPLTLVTQMDVELIVIERENVGLWNRYNMYERFGSTVVLFMRM